MSDLIEKRADGTTVVYIALWRYLFFGLLFALAFYELLSIVVNLYKERPADFWQHWSQTAELMLGALVGAIALAVFAYYWIRKDFYKKIQLEIGRSSLRYLSGGVRGGVLFSDTYRSINYHDIKDMNMKQEFFTNGVVTIQTLSETHRIILMLSESEKIRCLDVIRGAVEAARTQI
ncbi:hypothetical protein [Mucilaginibacter sp. UYNi724]